MARPPRYDVDYFPFICNEGKKMFYLEETYGNDGFAVFIKILRELAKTDNHWLNLSQQKTMMFIAAKCKVNIERLNNIINDLVELEKFDKLLWEENKVIWCQDFIDSIQDAYKKRKNKCIDYNSLLELLDSLGVRKLDKSQLKVPVYPQRKEEDRIKEETIVEDADILYNVDLLKSHYLGKEKLIQALIGNKKLNFKNKDQIEQAIIEFTSHLKSKAKFSESWTEYTSYFLNRYKASLKNSTKDEVKKRTSKIPIG